MRKITKIISWLTLIFSILGIIALSLFIGHATIDAETWSITMGNWGKFIGFWISIVFYWLLFNHIEKTGYKKGFKDGVKSMESK